MAVAGLLMFGNDVRNEITSNILVTSEYPRALSICVVVFIAIIPLTKIPLKYVQLLGFSVFMLPIVIGISLPRLGVTVSCLFLSWNSSYACL